MKIQRFTNRFAMSVTSPSPDAFKGGREAKALLYVFRRPVSLVLVASAKAGRGIAGKGAEGTIEVFGGLEAHLVGDLVDISAGGGE